MRSVAQSDFNDIKDFEAAKPFLTRLCNELIKIINGNITISDNVAPYLVDVVFPAANTEVSVPHVLRFEPSGYLKVGSSAAMTIYNGLTANTADRIYLRSSAIGTAKIWIF